MTTTEAINALERVTDAIAEIDLECRTMLDNIEHGLANIKLEFRDRALQETGKKLTEERLIAWLVHQKLGRAGLKVEWEVSYPDNRGRKCDLVIDLASTGQLWLELKLAWKAWFNCQGSATYSNGNYLPYLQGKHHTHSFRHDFEKLGSANFPANVGRAVCLIGFDWVNAPMDTEVSAVVQAVSQDHGQWETTTERRWPDRRCHDFRISVWSWVLQSEPKRTEIVDGADTATKFVSGSLKLE